MPTLRETQRRFFELITAPEDVARTLEKRGIAASYVEEIVNSDEKRSALGRLDIYAHMYFFRLLEILQADHPALAAALGEDGFHNLATDYLLAHPSDDPSVRHMSRHLPEFLDARSAWLAELARLEQARLFCFDAAEAEPLALDELQGLDVASLPIRLVPASRRLSCRFAVDECWAQADEGQAVDEPAEAPRTLLVWRQGVEVFHRALDGDEVPLLDCPSFGLVCEQLAAAQEPEAAAARAFALLARWVSDGVIVRPA
jgi:hypothetical protein